MRLGDIDCVAVCDVLGVDVSVPLDVDDGVNDGDCVDVEDCVRV